MNPEPFYIGSNAVPGLYQKIVVPSRELNWSITGGATGSLGAATVWRGVKIPEGGIVIETLITDDAGRVISDINEALGVWVPFLTLVHPDPKIKPPTWTCFHPLLIAVRPVIADCAMHSNAIVSPRNDHLSWHGVLILQAIVPQKKVAAAKPDPAKIDNKTPQAKDAAEEMIERLAKEAGLWPEEKKP